MLFSGCLDDATFGPAVHGCRGSFDFTLTFENVLFSIIPSAIFIVSSTIRTLVLVRRPNVVRAAILLSIKTLSISVFAVLRFSLLVQSSKQSQLSSLDKLIVASSALEFVAALCMFMLSWLEHSRSLRPSILLNGYLSITVLLKTAQSRSLWLAATDIHDRAFAAVSTASCALAAIIIATESQQKSRWLQLHIKDHSPEETSGIYALATFSWLSKLFITGYNQVLTLDDLFSLGPSMSSQKLGEKLESHLVVNATQANKFGLAKALAKVLAVPFLTPVAPRIALLIFTFCQPLLINAVLNYIETPESVRSANLGYGLIGATVIIYTGMAISNSLYYYFQERALWMARGTLANLVYKKTTQSRINAADNYAALTLMSTDIERIRVGLLAFHDFWASLIEVGLASWLLYRQLGNAFTAPIILVIVCMFCLAAVSSLSGTRQRFWMEKMQQRVGSTSGLIANVKSLKISGMMRAVELWIQQLRVDEIQAGGKWRMVMIMAFVISFTPSMLGPVLTFAFTVKTLDVARIFTALSFLSLLTSPLSQVFQLVPPLLAAFTCLERIQEFLEQSPREDYRKYNLRPTSSTSNDAVKDERTAVLIQVRQGSFGWTKEKPALRNLDIDIPMSRLTMVVGPVASGKSTFCNVLLGESPFYKGHVTMRQAPNPLGYSAQVAFLSNSTIRENIIGYSAFDELRYREVVDAVMLRPDFETLPLGDCTQAGSNGIALSGGQKQRVSMARALYLESNFLIFDDTLSGLDADTEEQVFTQIFGPGGLIRRRNATAILCTHSVRHLPYADHIIAVDSDGTVIEQGTFKDLATNGKYIQSLKIKTSVSRDNEAARPGLSIPGNSTKDQAEPKQAPTVASVMPIQAGGESRRTGDWSVYKHYANTMTPTALVMFVFIAAAIGFLFNFPQIWLQYWSADVAAKPHMAHSQKYWVGIYALLQISCLICLAIGGTAVFIVIIAQTGRTLHHRALATVVNAPLRFFTTTHAGVVTNLFSQDMGLIDTELPQALLNCVMEVFICIGMLAVVATSSPYLLISYPFLAAVLWLLQKFYLRTSRQLRFLDLEAKSPLYTHFTDTINGLATLRASGWVQKSLQANNRLLDDSQRPAYLLSMIQQWLTFVLYIVVALLALLVVALATQVKAFTNAGLTGASLVTLMSFGAFVSHLISTYTLLETSIGAVSRLREFSEKTSTEGWAGEDIVPDPLWPAFGAINIKEVTASYHPPENEETEKNANSGVNLALQDLNLDIGPGQKVALCGRSGSGKSSVILLLLRLLDPIANNTSTLTIDGLSLKHVDRTILRQRVIAISQDAAFLPEGSSFKANLDTSSSSTDEECHDVLQKLGLWSFVEERGGLDGAVSADILSQGQRQLYILARAVLRHRNRAREAHEASKSYNETLENSANTHSSKSQIGGLLLLDEVSSSVDKVTEQLMHEMIEQEFSKYTVIMVAHRLNVVMNMDKIFVMAKGKIIESGNPRELVKKDNGSFKELYNIGEFPEPS